MLSVHEDCNSHLLYVVVKVSLDVAAMLDVVETLVVDAHSVITV